MRIVVYTAIFGNYSGLITQPRFDNVDYICFTDQKIKSRSWNIKEVAPIFEDNTRNNRFYKILPHKHLNNYDISIYIDANFLITGNLLELIDQEFDQNLFMSFNHNEALGDERDCIYDEFEHILKLGSKKGKYKDDPDVMREQMTRYQKEGFPKNYGLICGGVIIRRHNEKSVIDLMEAWWKELQKGSKRDQLSFNYVCWRLNFRNVYLAGNISRGNPWFCAIGGNRKNYTKKILQYRIKKILRKV